jgi:hypothetical protein
MMAARQETQAIPSFFDVRDPSGAYARRTRGAPRSTPSRTNPILVLYSADILANIQNTGATQQKRHRFRCPSGIPSRSPSVRKWLQLFHVLEKLAQLRIGLIFPVYRLRAVPAKRELSDLGHARSLQ